MKKISKEVIDVKNVNVNAGLHPHPLIPDSYADIEVEWFSWIPGFDETDLGDGWEDAEVHNNPQSTREKALKMGANIINYVFKN